MRILASADRLDFRSLLAESATLPDGAAGALADALAPLRPLDIDTVEVLSPTTVAVTGQASGACWRVVVGVEESLPHGLTDIDFHRCDEVVEWATLAPGERVQVVGPDATVCRAFAEALGRMRRDWRLAGLAAVLHTASVSATFTAGFSNPWTRDRVTIDSPFRLASLAKGWSAVAALQLVDDGVVGLDETVAPHVPVEMPPDITLRHLLTHTSGLDNRWPSPVHGHEPATGRDARELLGKGLRRVAPPGTTFAYSNHGFALIGLMIETVTGRVIEDALTEVVGQTLEATSIRFDEPAQRPPGTALEGGAVVPAPAVFPLLLAAGGGWSTAEGAVRLAVNLVPGGPNKLSARVVQMLTTDQAPPGTGARSAGLALYRDAADRLWAGHVGGWPGFSGAFLACPELDTACAVLTNQSTPNRFEIPGALIRALTH